MSRQMILPDVLSPDLKVVFAGTAVSDRSAKLRRYYAGRGNQFWLILKKIGLIPEEFNPEEFQRLSELGVGLTDVVKRRSGNDRELQTGDFDVSNFREKIRKYSPKFLAFNGKKSAEKFLGHPVSYGIQTEKIGHTSILVLPSTSGAARAHWNDRDWMDLAEMLKRAKQ